MPLLLVKTIGATKSKHLQVAEGITGASLHARVAELTGLTKEKLKVVLHGKVIPVEWDEVPALRDGDTVIALIAPQPPQGTDEQAEDELVFKLPASASWSERKVATFLKQRLHLPDYVLVAFFGLRLRTWLLILAWFLAAPLAQHWDLGPLYVGATNGERDSGWWSGLKAGRVGVGVADYPFLLRPHLYKLGEKRGRGKKDTKIRNPLLCGSAYSIFNENFEELPGTLNAERLDRDIRAGQF